MRDEDGLIVVRSVPPQQVPTLYSTERLKSTACNATVGFYLDTRSVHLSLRHCHPFACCLLIQLYNRGSHSGTLPHPIPSFSTLRTWWARALCTLCASSGAHNLSGLHTSDISYFDIDWGTSSITTSSKREGIPRRSSACIINLARLFASMARGALFYRSVDQVRIISGTHIAVRTRLFIAFCYGNPDAFPLCL